MLSDAVNCFEAVLPPELASVVASRRLVESSATSWGIDEDTAADAALAISELVTNAVLHAGTVMHVVVRRLGRGIRLEVGDGSPRLPVVGADRPEDLLETRSMTGRGLTLLAATADRWGADPVGTGKVMWVEIGTGRRHPVTMSSPPQAAIWPEPAPDPAASWAGVTSVTAIAAEGHKVHLIGVPVRLLVESARQLADLQREMQVVGLDQNGPEELVALAEASREISAQMSDLRQDGRDFAEAAIARGQAVIDFDVDVPEGAVAVFDRLGSLVRRVAETLVGRQVLTVPPSDQVVAYRRWFRDEIEAQLEGRAPRPCPLAAATVS